jgi:hypothetical protein
MRLIDADELLTDPYFQDESIPEKDMFIEAVEDSPTIDAVEVVRCRDCMHREINAVNPNWMYCHRIVSSMKFDPDFYCAYGKKMDAEVSGDE